MNVPHKYGVVRAIAFVLKLLAWLALVGAVVAAVIAVITAGGASASRIIQVAQLSGLLMAFLLGVVWFIQLFAFGSILTLLLDIEENTRALSLEGSA